MEMYPSDWRVRIRNRVTSLLASFAETVDLQAFNALMIGLCAWISLHQFSPFSEVDFWADVEDKYTESYRSGHNEPHSKSHFFGAVPPQNWIRKRIEVVITSLTRNRNRFVERSTRKSLDLCRFSRVRRRKNLWVLPISSPHFPKRIGWTYNLEGCPSGRRCDSRKAVFLTEPWVRIPLSPPECSVCKRFLPFAGFFFFSTLERFFRKFSPWFELRICSWRILSEAIRRRSYEITSNAPLRPFTIASADDSLEL